MARSDPVWIATALEIHIYDGEVVSGTARPSVFARIARRPLESICVNLQLAIFLFMVHDGPETVARKKTQKKIVFSNVVLTNISSVGAGE